MKFDIGHGSVERCVGGVVEKVPEDVLTEEGKGKQSQGVFEERRDCHIVYLNWKGLPVSGMSSQFRERYRTARHHGTGKVNRGEVREFWLKKA